MVAQVRSERARRRREAGQPARSGSRMQKWEIESSSARVASFPSRGHWRDRERRRGKERDTDTHTKGGGTQRGRSDGIGSS